MKKGIIIFCFSNALAKSCAHKIDNSFKNQALRLRSSGYPVTLLSVVAENSLKKLKNKNRNRTIVLKKKKEKVGVLPYLQKAPCNLKRVGLHAGVNVVFSAPVKLVSLSNKVN